MEEDLEKLFQKNVQKYTQKLKKIHECDVWLVLPWWPTAFCSDTKDTKDNNKDILLERNRHLGVIYLLGVVIRTVKPVRCGTFDDRKKNPKPRTSLLYTKHLKNYKNYNPDIKAGLEEFKKNFLNKSSKEIM